MKIYSELFQFHSKWRVALACCKLPNPTPQRFFFVGIFYRCLALMVEEVDIKNLYIAVSSPDLNFNITSELEISNDVTGNEKFYSISMPVDIQVM